MISKRLLTAVSFLKGRNVIDVGADHGELELYLTKHDLVDKVLAIENKVGPYNRLVNAVNNEPKVIPLLSDGLKDITSDITSAFLLGMGGELIISIIEKDFDKLASVEQFVVDAHRDTDKVRTYLTNHGYKIEKEAIVFEKGIYYFVISFIKGTQVLSESETLFGYKTYLDPLWSQYKSYELARLTALYEKSHNKKIQNKIRRLLSNEHD